MVACNDQGRFIFRAIMAISKAHEFEEVELLAIFQSFQLCEVQNISIIQVERDCLLME